MAKPKLNLKALDGVENSYDERPTRPCMSCGQNDKAPRDQVGLPDGNVAFYHIDCHAMLGCPVCTEMLRVLGTNETNDGLKNEELWLNIVDKSTLNPGSATDEFFERVDTTGAYDAAVKEGLVKDETWGKEGMN